LLHACGNLALARGKREEAWNFATKSLDLATTTRSRKHIARARQLQGEIMSADGKLDYVRKYDLDVGGFTQWWSGMVPLA